MAVLVENCPRCGAQQITFDVNSQNHRGSGANDWQIRFEVFCICRRCHRSTVFFVELKQYEACGAFSKDNALTGYTKSLNEFFDVEGYISLKDHVSHLPPAHLPKAIDNAFKEGAACFSIQCFNAAATMLRLCIDIATRPLLPDPSDGASEQPNSRTRRDLGLRLTWLFDKGTLPPTLRSLAKCIREDANDGAHVGSLLEADAEDLLDFTTMILERLFTEPERLRIAEERRKQRRS